MISLLLFTLGTIAFTISSLTAGGGGLLLIPILNTILGTSNTAPVLNLGSIFGRPIRLFFYRKEINWAITLYYTVPAFVGSYIAGWAFQKMNIAWFQIIIGLFLISTLFQFNFGNKASSFKMKLVHFIPLGFLLSFIGTFTGGTGPVLNPFYLNYGLIKEELIATKTANSFFVGLAQISSYYYFDILNSGIFFHAVALGAGIGFGSYLGKNLLKKVDNLLFRKMVVWMMVVSGLAILIKATQQLF